MHVSATLPQHNLRDVPDEVRRIEADGYDCVVTMENRHEPFIPLGIAAVHSERVRLSTSVAISFPRSPMVTASTAWDLQAASNGRFVLGIGSQVKGHNERRFSVPWSAPAPRMAEYVQALRAIWHTWATGERLSYEGEHYRFSLMTPNFTPEPLDGPPPPIMIAAVGPAMLRVAGQHCDGVRLHGFCTPDYLREHVMPQLQTGLDRAGHNRSDFWVTGGGFICTGPDDETVDRMVEWVRYRIGFYGSTRAYWPVLEQHDLGELGEKLNHLSRNDGWGKMAGCIDDDVVRLFAAVGRHDEIASAIADHFDGLVDEVNANVAADIGADLPPDVIQDIQAVPTAGNSA
ncbi:TIGR03617 family F420-dependent LLM class oxidoreductase [Candidatus Poriferisodalis sp.]|uniref:TIGR03617 family F420-dependent LLM class oxidoreductase n=1 Tax=Candidatus Poriferisodalis sp. TaxID=3101277 RepID=UPI003B52E752